MELELLRPVPKAYPAGTKIRMHTSSYGSYVYTTVVGKVIPKTWKTYTGNATLAKPGQMSLSFLRPGTAYVKVIMLVNYRKAKDEKIAYTDLNLKVSE